MSYVNTSKWYLRVKPSPLNDYGLEAGDTLDLVIRDV